MRNKAKATASWLSLFLQKKKTNLTKKFPWSRFRARYNPDWASSPDAEAVRATSVGRGDRAAARMVAGAAAVVMVVVVVAAMPVAGGSVAFAGGAVLAARLICRKPLDDAISGEHPAIDREVSADHKGPHGCVLLGECV